MKRAFECGAGNVLGSPPSWAFEGAAARLACQKGGADPRHECHTPPLLRGALHSPQASGLGLGLASRRFAGG